MVIWSKLDGETDSYQPSLYYSGKIFEVMQIISELVTGAGNKIINNGLGSYTAQQTGQFSYDAEMYNIMVQVRILMEIQKL